jgi:hypothetical protein
MENEELTAEQAHYVALEEFAADTKNIRFVESHANWRKLMDFIRDHNLETTAQNLRFAFLSLSKDGLLDLLPLGHLAPPQPTQPEAPAPTAQPAPVVPARARTFAMFRNGAAISGSVRSL